MTGQALAKDWNLVRFGEVAENISKRVNPSAGDEKEYIGLEHLDSGSLEVRRWGSEVVLKGQKFAIKKGDILFAKRNAYLKRVALAPFDGIFSAHGMVIRPLGGDMHPEFLPFFMQSNTFMNRAISVSEGSLSPTIKWKTLAAQEFKIPPLTEQKRLLEILKKASESLSKLDELESSFSQMVSTIIEDKIRQFCPNEISIGELIQSGDILGIQDGNHGNDHPKASDYVGHGIPFVMASDLTNGSINLDQCKNLKKELADKLRIGFSKPGDILLSHKGTVGLVAVTPEVTDYIMLTPQVTYYRVKDGGRLRSKFLEIYFRSQSFQRSLKALSAQSTRAYIGITSQKKMNVPLPLDWQQDEIIHLWGCMEETKDRIRTKKTATYKLSESIINGC